MLKFTCTVTLADFQAAQVLHWRQTFLRRIFHSSVYWLPVLCGSLGIALGSRTGIFLKGWSFWSAFALGLLVCTPITALMPKDRSKGIRKIFERRYPSDKRTAWYEIHNEGITTAIAGTDAETIRWDKIVGFAGDEKITLLYLGNNRFLFFPTSALTGEQLAELNDLVARHVVKR